MTLAVRWIPSPNYFPGRLGHSPNWTPEAPGSWIVLHTQDGWSVNTIRAFQSSARAASSTYVASLDGSLVQMVKETDGPWTNGTNDGVGSNLDSITIECEDGGNYNGPRTPELYESVAQLVADISRRRGIPLIHRGAGGGVLGHRECSGSSTACPDSLNVAGIIARARVIAGGAVSPESSTRRRTCIVATTKSLHEFCRGGDKALYHRRRSAGTWSPWVKLGGRLGSPEIIAGVDDRGTIVVTVTGGKPDGTSDGLFYDFVSSDDGLTFAPPVANAAGGDGMTMLAVLEPSAAGAAVDLSGIAQAAQDAKAAAVQASTDAQAARSASEGARASADAVKQDTGELMGLLPGR